VTYVFCMEDELAKERPIVPVACNQPAGLKAMGSESEIAYCDCRLLRTKQGIADIVERA
jgi:hypothetical protein